MEFTTVKKGNVLLVKLPPLNNPDVLKPLTVQMKKWLLEDSDIYLFNFESVHSMDQSISREFGLFSRNLKNHFKAMHSINLNSSLQNEMKKKGIIDVFGPVADINKIIQKANQMKQKG